MAGELGDLWRLWQIWVACRGSGFETCQTPATHRTTTRLSKQTSSRRSHGPRREPLLSGSKSCLEHSCKSPALSWPKVVGHRSSLRLPYPSSPIVVVNGVTSVGTSVGSRPASLQCSASSFSAADWSLPVCDTLRRFCRVRELRISDINIFTDASSLPTQGRIKACGFQSLPANATNGISHLVVRPGRGCLHPCLFYGSKSRPMACVARHLASSFMNITSAGAHFASLFAAHLGGSSPARILLMTSAHARSVGCE